ncbi:hypothetical protein GGH12_003097 [Coemansia sp. RSA 1822]|nr:hypothetical protein LPJ76_003304 [Coemansia sp. RSA 638]KAJ2122108.1 hypothetical protein IW147_003700 [Coemansia sp. RSA 720]KAJ2541467.1 hypothetical protein GGF49_003629 [Coemansia sp. RSA 1853]KAJ2562645.1 hypothetical protein GGH12_003097 [Coemansia sp. RSA 1822]
MDTKQLQEYLDTAVMLAKEVGPAFKDGFWRTGQFAATSDFAAEDKQGNQADCVTAVDCFIEKTIFTRLRQIYPSHKFVGEETTAETGNEYKVTDDPTWIVDPVDGTNNFVHHFPYTGISIGVAINKEPVVGVVYLPILDELYTAARGMGAHLNGQQLPLFKPPVLTTPLSLAQCSMVAEHGSARCAKIMKSRFDSFARLLLDKEHGGACLQNLRITGAAAPDLALVAKGVAEMYWECGPHAWDFAAGVVLVLESGGAVFDGAGWWGSNVPCEDRVPQPLNIWNRKIVAVRHVPDLPGQPGSGREIQKQLVAELLETVEDIPYTPDGSH